MRKHLKPDQYEDRDIPARLGKYRDHKREHERDALKEALDEMRELNDET